MVGIVIATHGNLSHELINTAEIIVGKQKNIQFVTFLVGDGIDYLREEIKNKIILCDEGDGVIVLTDIIGGSPNNSVLYNLSEISNKIECISGVNLAMLLECILLRNANNTLEEISKNCYEQGRNSIVNSTKLLREK